MSDSDAPEQPKKQRIQPRNFGKKRTGDEESPKKLTLDGARRQESVKPAAEPAAASLREPGKPLPPAPSAQKSTSPEYFIAPGRGGVPVSKGEVRRKRDRETLAGKLTAKRVGLILIAISIMAGLGVWWATRSATPGNTGISDLEQVEEVNEPPLQPVQPSAPPLPAPAPPIEELSPMELVQGKLNPYLERLQSLQEAGNTEGIDQVFRDAAAETSNLPFFWLQMGALYYGHLRQSDESNATIIPKANPFFERAMRFGSELPVVLSHASTYFVETGQIDAGLKALQRLAQLRPTDAGVLQQLAFTQTATGRTDEAISTLQQMMAIDPGDARPRLAYANLLEETGRFEDAAEAYRVYLSLNPGDVPTILRNAQLLKSQGRTEGARGALERAIQSHPENINLQANYAVLLLESKDYDGALAAFDAVEKLVPPDSPPTVVATLLMGRGSAYYEMGNLDQAEQLFEEAYRLIPEGNADASNNLAYIWARKSKNLEQATSMAERNVQEMPENPSYRHTLALALFRQGQSKAALEHLELALGNSPEPSGDLLETLGDVNASMGAQAEAQRFYARALALAPGNEALRAKITE